MGDAMIIVWPPPEYKHENGEFIVNEPKDENGKTLKTRARRAAQCALEIQSEFHNKQIMQGF